MSDKACDMTYESRKAWHEKICELEQRIEKLEQEMRNVETYTKTHDYQDEVFQLQLKVGELEQRQRSTDASIWALAMEPKKDESIKELSLEVKTAITKAIEAYETAVKEMQPKPTFYRGQEVEVYHYPDGWLSGLYVGKSDAPTFPHWVFIDQHRSDNLVSEEDIRPKQEGNK